ncbi:nuclear protein MDM1-like isoform X2 [Littorina saxatilis]|uniref:Nuclear protein MDM1 n=1 Tax=Littorina saxatilis TaxID=31220 RepID=A0AAN9BAY2_9CAEN
MPAKGKESEYKTHFKWLESFRGKGFKPEPEQMAPPAGLGSVFISPCAEPPLQHKKRVEGPRTSLSINLDDGNYPATDEFAILGQHEKFAPNVRYSLRPAKHSKLANNPTNVNSSNSAKDQPPPPKQMKMGDKQTHGRRKVEMSDARGKKEQSKENVTPTSPPPAPRKPQQTDQQVVKEGLRDKNLSDILPRAKSAHSKDKLNEFAQTNMDKGVALSAPEATSDYSLKYKAGIAPKLGRKASEYQKEFRWRNAVPASPLLNAEQIVYSSNTALSPVKAVKFHQKTEYQTQFKPYEIPETVSFAPKPSQEPAGMSGRTKTQMKRSKSVGAVDRGAAGVPPVTYADDPRQLRESGKGIPAPKVPIPHGRLKRVVSEYRSNFKAPTGFSYEEGAWRNAYPPQLAMVKNGSGDDKEVKKPKAEPESQEAGSVPNWFAEVLELRRRANEYKRRAQGTHFSREHLVQLLAKQATYRDDCDNSATVTALDALALEPAKPPARRAKPSKQEEDPVDKLSHVAVRGDSPKPRDNNNQSNQHSEKRGRSSKRNKVMAWQEQSQQHKDSNQNAAVQARLDKKENAAVRAEFVGNMRQNTAAQAMEDFAESASVQVDLDCSEIASDAAVQTEGDENAGVQGRLPTPVIRQQGLKASRHHLDRTTPSMGGVLLSLPRQPLSTDRSGDSGETPSECQSSPKLKLSTLKLATSPILGIPTPDTHPLRDDDAESDHALHTQFIHTPAVAAVKVDKKKRAEQRKLNAKVPTTIDERMGLTYNKDGHFHADDLPLATSHVVEDDALSLSAMSIASSSSLASEVYERARRRRDEFWGKPRK